VETQRARLNADTAKAEQVSKAAATANEARAAQLRADADRLEAHKQQFNKMQADFNDSYAKRAALLSQQERLADERLKAAATEAERVNAERAKIEAERARVANDADYKRVNAEYEAENRRLARQQGTIQAELKRIPPAPEPPKPPTPEPVQKPSVSVTPKPILADVVKNKPKIVATVAKRFASAAAKAAVKSIPVIGLGLGVAAIAYRIVIGDAVGAGVEVVGTFGSFVTAIPATITNMARDIYHEEFGEWPESDPAPDKAERWKFIYDTVREAVENELKSSYITEMDYGKAATEMQGTPLTVPDESDATPRKGIMPSIRGWFTRPETPTRNIPRRGSGTPIRKPVSMPTITPEDKPIMALIKKHEGVRLSPYKDSLGLWTVGVGHLIGDGKSLPPEWNRQFTMEEVDALFAKDYIKHKQGAEQGPGYDKANQTGKAALIDLAFNMGNTWYNKFPNTTRSLEAGDFDTASAHLQDSLWYKQVGNRGPTIISMIRSGTDMSMNTIVPRQNETGTQLAQVSTIVNAAKQRPTASPTIIVAHNTTQALAASNGPQGRAEFIGAVGA
jgi:lysozyme